MESYDEEPTLCPICGGVKPEKNREKNSPCECICLSCSDGKDMD